MSSAHELDLGPLTWVKGEIDLALERALTALAEAGNTPDGLDRIKFAQTHLHQAHGALSIVGLDGLTQFSEQLDRLLGELASEQVAFTPQATRLAARCIAAIGNYLDELVRGQPDQALRLFSLYAELAELRGQEPPTPGELFFPDLTQRPVFPAPSEDNADPKRLRALRGRFERGLLKWFRNAQDPSGPQEMREAVAGIECLQTIPASRAFWFAASAFFDVLSQQGIAADAATKRLCGRIDGQMRRLMEGSAIVAERLMRDVLYHVAIATCESPASGTIRQAYQLTALIPSGKRTLSDTPRAPVLRKLRDGLGEAKEAWNYFSKGSAIGLPRFQDALAPLAAEAETLGQPEAAHLIEALDDLARWLRQDPLQLTEALSMDVATTMLLLEARLDTHEQSEQQDDAQIAVFLQRLKAHQRGERLAPLTLAEPESQTRQVGRQLAHEILASLAEVEQNLDSFFRAPTRSDVLAAVRAPLKQIEGALSVMNEDAAVRLLQDAAARIAALSTAEQPEADTSAFEEIAHRLSALGVYIEALQHGPADLERILRPNDGDSEPSGTSLEAELVQQKRETAALAAALKDNPDDFGLRTELQLNLENLRQDASLTADAELEKQARQALTMLDAGELFSDAEAIGSTPETPALSAEASRLLDASEAEIDAELLAIFLEEASEVRDAIAARLAQLRQAPHDTEVLTTIRRSFHTLKGSGRMVGLKDFGEAAWGMEQTLNHWLRLELPVTSALLALIGAAHTAVTAWVAQLQAGGGASRDVAELLAEAERLRRDGAATTEPALAPIELAPVVLPESVLPEESPLPEFSVEEVDAPLEDGEPEFDLEASITLADLNFLDVPLAPEEAPAAPAPGGSSAIDFPDIYFEDEADVEEALPADTVAEFIDLDETPEPSAAYPDAADLAALAAAPETSETTFPAPDTAAEAAADEDTEEDLEAGALDSEALVGEALDAGLLELDFALPSDAFDTPPTAEEALAALEEEALGDDDLATAEASRLDDAPPSFDAATVDTAEPALLDGIPDQIEDFHDAEDLALEDEADTDDPDEVRLGDVSLSRPLFDLYLVEARQHVATLRHELARLSVNPTLVPPTTAIRAAHTLSGISGTARFSAPQQLAKALELAQQRLADHDRSPTADQTEILNAAAAALESMLVQLASRLLPPPETALLEALDAILVAHLADVINLRPDSLPPKLVTANIPAPQRGEAAPRPGDGAPQLRDELDPELLPIFLDEGSELLDHLDLALRNWRESPAEPAHAHSVARLLHTLKGSARMVGAMNLGQSLHELETRLERARSLDPAGQAIIEEIENTLDQARQSLDALASGQLPAPAAEPVADDELPADTLPAAAPGDLVAQAGRAQLRVEASRIDQFVNEAGEISIARTRMEGELRTVRRSLLDLTENVIRLRNQLREVEIQADTQMQSRLSQVETHHSEFDPLEMDRYTRLQELTRMMAESVGDVTTVQQNLLRNLDGAEAALHAQSRMTRELQQSLMHVRMVPFDSLAERLYRLVRQTAKELGRRANLDIIGGQIEIDRSVLETMTGPLGHLVRNAVAHGIEPPEVRRAAGKPEIGQITLKVAQQGNEVLISFRDDGAGLDFPRIRAHAIETGLLQADEDADDKRLSNLIFVPGFTTADLSSLAGRGVGMDVVKSETAAVGGRISVTTTPGQETCFHIHLPLTLAVTQALLVRAAGRTFAIPSSMIAQVLELKAPALEQLRAAHGTEWLGEHFGYRYLPRLLGDPVSQPPVERFNWVLLLRAGSETVALHVDALRGNQEVVVKNAGPQFARMVGYSGATVLGDGEIVLILNPVALAGRNPAGPADVPVTPSARAPGQPTVMVVDDSLTVRKITGRLLEREGFRVITAKDGVDALEQLLTVKPDVIIADIEMPRMDGFDLTRNIRADARLKDVPIIMITSRTADKHKRYAAEIGVDHYLGKPYDEEQLLGLIRDFVAAGVH